jgi:hypothetical protein
MLLALALPTLAGLACTGGGSDINSGVLGQILDSARSTTVLIRVVNQTTSDLTATINVDGVEKVLPICTSVQSICDYLLATCPTTIALVQEVRQDANEDFTGGRNFEGNPDFTFTNGEFNCGGTIIFQFSDTQASATAM